MTSSRRHRRDARRNRPSRPVIPLTLYDRPANMFVADFIAHLRSTSSPGAKVREEGAPVFLAGDGTALAG
jgi:hypothetical protein